MVSPNTQETNHHPHPQAVLYVEESASSLFLSQGDQKTTTRSLTTLQPLSEVSSLSMHAILN